MLNALYAVALYKLLIFLPKAIIFHTLTLRGGAQVKKGGLATLGM